MLAIAYSTTNKTFAIVSQDLARAMIFMGNPHGFDRAKNLKNSEKKQFLGILAENKYKELDGETLA